MRLTRLEGHAQWLTFTEEVILPNHVGERAGTQALGQRGMRRRLTAPGQRARALRLMGLWQIQGQGVLHGEIVARARVPHQKPEM